MRSGRSRKSRKNGNKEFHRYSGEQDFDYSTYSRDRRELTDEQRRYLELVHNERIPKQGGKRRKHSSRQMSRRINSDANRTSKSNKGKNKVKRAVLIIIVIILLILGLGYLYFSKLTSKLDYIPTEKKDFAINPTVEKNLSGYRCVAILGSDARKGQGYDGSRTDAIIVAVIDKSTNNIQLVSVLRDAYLKIEDASGASKLDKITHAHAYGGGVNTCKSLNKSLDLNISEFVIFNWKAVSDLVNEMGGIKVDIKSYEIGDMNHYGPETARNVDGKYKNIIQPGKQTIDGPQAATYCRIRKTSGGDPKRGSRMKIVMSALMNKAKETKISTLNQIAEKVFPEIRTNISKTGILKTVIKVPVYKFGKNRQWPKDYYGGLMNGVWYAVPRTLESQVKFLYNTVFNKSDYIPSETVKSISNEIVNITGIR